jgi:rhomboid protease GluP
LHNLSRLPATFGLIGACVAVYLAVAVAGQGYGFPLNVGLVTQPIEVVGKGALVPALVARGQVWRLVSSMFLHSGFIHLTLNMLSLYFLGAFMEVTFGRARFLALYLTSGLAGGIACLYFGDFDGSVVGASGAIFGLLGGVLGYSLRRGTFSWQNPLIRQLLILTALNLYIGFSIPNISNAAHIGGLLSGLAFGWLVAPTVYIQKKALAATPTIIVLGMEMVLLTVWCFIFV